MTEISKERIDALYNQLNKDALASGYHLNPDREFVDTLIEGLLVNQDRYGYLACPCRLASGDKAADLDIICPCDYRDPDLSEFGACYCALYVSAGIAKGEAQPESIPDRRPVGGPVREAHDAPVQAKLDGLPYPVWRCKVCGYLCARDEAPEVCPICKVKKERFERFI